MNKTEDDEMDAEELTEEELKQVAGTWWQKKTPTHVFFYVSLENVSMYTKVSGMFVKN